MTMIDKPPKVTILFYKRILSVGIIEEYIHDRCAADDALTPDAFNWHWSIDYLADQENKKLSFTDPQGRFLTCGTGGGLILTDEMADNDLSLWTLREANGGWFIISAAGSANADYNQAIQFYHGRFSTYHCNGTGYFIFNFYETEPGE